MLTIKQLKKKADELIAMGILVSGEGEPLELTDVDLTMHEMAQLRSKLSSMRVSIDLVNKALAVYWHERYPGERIETEGTEWYVGQKKTRRVVDDTLFMEWVASRDIDQLEKLFKASRLAGTIKTTAMTPAEVDTHIETAYTNAGLSINHKEKIE